MILIDTPYQETEVQERLSSAIKLWIAGRIFTLALCLGVGEIMARLTKVSIFRVQQSEQSTGRAVQDPVLGWRNNPGVHVAHEGPREAMTIFSDGSRTTGTHAATASTIVIILGCSFAEGYGVFEELDHSLFCRITAHAVRITERKTGLTWNRTRNVMERLHLIEFFHHRPRLAYVG